MYQLVDGKYQAQAFKGSERIISSTFPELELPTEQIITAVRLEKSNFFPIRYPVFELHSIVSLMGISAFWSSSNVFPTWDSIERAAIAPPSLEFLHSKVFKNESLTFNREKSPARAGTV